MAPVYYKPGKNHLHPQKQQRAFALDFNALSIPVCFSKKRTLLFNKREVRPSEGSLPRYGLELEKFQKQGNTSSPNFIQIGPDHSWVIC